MHELLASIFLTVDYDSLDHWTSGIQDKDILEMCDRTWVAADAWYLFGIVMEHVNPWYEWRESPSKGLQSSTEGLQPYSAPIVNICDRIQNLHLKNVDPTLWRRMNEVGIEPQLFGM
jgi:TBC1 domain family protein 5